MICEIYVLKAFLSKLTMNPCPKGNQGGQPWLRKQGLFQVLIVELKPES